MEMTMEVIEAWKLEIATIYGQFFVSQNTFIGLYITATKMSVV